MSEYDGKAREGNPIRAPRKHRVRRILLIGLLGALAALVGLQLVPPTIASLGPATVSVGGEAGPGRTTFLVPPLGAVSADTHTSPIGLSLTVTELDTAALTEAVADPQARHHLEDAIEEDLRALTNRVALQLGLGGIILAALLAAVLPRRRLSTFGAGASGGAVAMTVVLILTAATFDVRAFQQPRFTGALERAPEVIDAIGRQFGSLDEIRSRYETGAARISGLLSLLAGGVPGPEDGTTAILHISDVHSNPIGIQVAAGLAARFDVAAVIDTGDLTSFGESIEGRIGDLIEDIGVPYYFIPGNHDSQGNRISISSVDNVTLVDEEVVEISGIRVLGWADPTFTATGELTTEEGNEIREETSLRVAEMVADTAPHVLAVHDARMASASVGTVPLVLAGHTHEERQQVVAGTRVLTVGSTGATGLGSFLVESELDYEAQIIYFLNARAVAIDYIRFRGLGGDFQVQRRSFEPLEPEGSPEAEGEAEPERLQVPTPTVTD